MNERQGASADSNCPLHDAGRVIGRCRFGSYKIHRMRMLALDTSTEWCSVAAGDGDDWHALDEHVGHAHSERVLPMVDAALAAAEWSLRDLDGIAFGAGPGSFTGIRIGCGVVQGLALGADLPVVAVSSLNAIAHDAWRANGWERVFAGVDARMREIYIAAHRREGNRWHEARAPAVMPPADAAAVRPRDEARWYGAGNAFAVYPELAAVLELVAVAPEARPRATAIAELALPRLLAGEGVAAAAASPLYVRHRVALTTAERDAGARL
jgi:tRNA threonylcarbamoyladenosine biosynthesis protein TsaB